MVVITLFGNPKVGMLTDFPGNNSFASLICTQGDTELKIFFDTIEDAREFAREVMRAANHCMASLHEEALIENEAYEAVKPEEKRVVLMGVQPS